MSNLAFREYQFTDDKIWALIMDNILDRKRKENVMHTAAISSDGLAVSDEFLQIAEKWFGSYVDSHEGYGRTLYTWSPDHITINYIMEFQKECIEHAESMAERISGA